MVKQKWLVAPVLGATLQIEPVKGIVLVNGSGGQVDRVITPPGAYPHHASTPSQARSPGP